MILSMMESQNPFCGPGITSCAIAGTEVTVNKQYCDDEDDKGSEESQSCIQKCSLCCQDFLNLSCNFEFEYDQLSGILIQSGDITNEQYLLCDHCQLLCSNLMAARDTFLQCVSDIITVTGRWVSNVEKAELLARLLDESKKPSSFLTSEDQDAFVQESSSDDIELPTDSHAADETADEDHHMGALPTIELTAVSIGDGLTPERIVLKIDHLNRQEASGKELEFAKSVFCQETETSFEIHPDCIAIASITAAVELDAERLKGEENNLDHVLSSGEHEGSILLPSMCDDGSPVPSDTEINQNKDYPPRSKKARKLYICTICSRICKTARELDLHTGVHLQERKFICEVCGLAYRHKKALEVHVGLHRGEAKFECEHCHKVFTQKSGLQRHLPIHTGEMAYQCDICGKRFLYNTSFNVHKFTHTKHKEFQCFECGLSFFSKSHLKRHMKTHTGVKPHVCESCGKCFSERYNLDAHMRIHTGQKSHKCPHCDLGFNRKGKLEAHIDQKHCPNSVNS